MSLKWLEGFEAHSTTSWTNIYQAIATGVSGFLTGRYGAQRAYRFQGTSGGGQSLGYIGKHTITTPTTNDFICGFAFRLAGNSAGVKPLMSITSDGIGFNGQASLWTSAVAGTTYTLSAYRGRGSVLLGAVPTWVGTVGVWYWIEMRVKVHDTTGTFTVRIDGVDYLTLTGQDTKQQTATTWDGFILGNVDGANTNYSFDFDDLYILEVDGSGHNDFLGELRGFSLVPTGAGASAQFTPNAGSNWDRVDEISEDDDTTYVESSTVGHKDTHAITNTSVTGTVIGMREFLRARKTDAGTRTARAIQRIGGTDYEGDSRILSATYQTWVQLREVSPATGVAYTTSEVDGMEYGYKVHA